MDGKAEARLARERSIEQIDTVAGCTEATGRKH